MITRMKLDIPKCNKYCSDTPGGGCPIYQRVERRLEKHSHFVRVQEKDSKSEFGLTYPIDESESAAKGWIKISNRREDSVGEGPSQCKFEVDIMLPDDSVLHEDIPREVAEGYRELRAFAKTFS